MSYPLQLGCKAWLGAGRALGSVISLAFMRDVDSTNSGVNKRGAGARAEGQDLFERAESHAPALVIRHVQNIVGQQGRVRRFALHDLAQRDLDFILAAVGSPPVNVGILGGVGRETLG